MNKLFKTLIILNIISAFIFMRLPMMMILSVVNVCFFLYLNSKEVNRILENKNMVLGLGILNFLSFRIISGALCISIYSELKHSSYHNNIDTKDNKPKIDPRIKKIDMLLKLGVAMVFIAGFIFATTSWNSISPILKMLLLLIVSVLFIFLSKFCENKIKIKSTIYLYWILGMAFLMFMVINAGLDSLFGNYFSLNGEGYLLYGMFAFTILSVLGFLSYINFNNKKFLYITYIGFLTAVMFVLNHYQLPLEQILFIFILLLTVPNFIKVQNDNPIYTLYRFSNKLIIFFNCLFIVLMEYYTKQNLSFVILSSLLLVFNVYYFIHCNKDSNECNSCPLLSYLAVIPVLNLLDADVSSLCLFTSIFMVCSYAFTKLIKSERLSKASLIYSNVLISIAFFLSLYSKFIWLPLVTTVLLMTIYIINKYVIKNHENTELSWQPVKISMLLLGAMYFFKDFITWSNLINYWLILTQLIWILTYCLTSKKESLDIYRKYSLIIIISNLLIFPLFNNLIIFSVLLLSVMLFFVEVQRDKSRKPSYINFVFTLLLYSIFAGVHSITDSLTNFYQVQMLISNIIILIIYAMLGLFYRKDKYKLNIFLLAIIFPIMSLLSSLSVEWVDIILPSVIVFYITFVVCKIIRNEQTKDMLAYLGYSFAFILTIFNNNPYVLGYSCIILFVSILIGYLSKKQNALFKTSIVMFGIFVIYQLKEFWNKIPAWLYLLIFGIALIVFATYKQLKLVEKENDSEQKK
ncbi:MAG: hypothetical protein IJO43_00740 [Bacilli bacterium]|nr:hypothetical protein [Bacilli bacterium]